MILKNYLLGLLFFILMPSFVVAQIEVPFTSRLAGGNFKIKGDLILVGNNIISSSATPNIAYNGVVTNNTEVGSYIDIDGDAATFSSSSSNLNIAASCKKIVFAGLYWTATYPHENGIDATSFINLSSLRQTDWNNVKFKMPGGSYLDLSADNNPDPAGDEDSIIFNGYNISNPSLSKLNSTYSCYKNVTNLLKSISNPNGDYTVANVRASRGLLKGGNAAGWTLVVIYESPTESTKFITVFDGYANINNEVGSTPLLNLDIPVNGFKTVPSPAAVKAKIGISAIDGDKGVVSDGISYKANSLATFAPLSDAVNPVNDFLNSTISNAGINTTRNPNSSNTQGFDIDNPIISNGGNAVLPNGETGGTIRISSANDGFGLFLTTFTTEVVEPKIVLTKVVTDNLGNPTGTNVILGQQLYYNIGFQNTGNDNAINFTIKDVLPANIVFNYPADLLLPAGVSSTYDVASRTLIITVPDSLVEVNDPRYEVIIKVKTPDTCYKLSAACSNIIQNQAFATYKSQSVPVIQVTDDPSIAEYSACILSTPSPTNFLVGLENCEFIKSEVLCGNSLVIKAADGYSSYSWSTNSSGTPVIGTSQTLTVTAPGTFYVVDTVAAPCTSIKETVNVKPFGNTVTNPVIPFNDEVLICPNDGKKMPNIFLCGANASRLINTNITDVSSISWDRLNVGSCPAIANTSCANENSSCTWTQVGTGANYNVNTAGQYRMFINYNGGCFNIFYFNVYQNTLNPTAVVTDIICSSPGKIVVSNVPSGYEYSFTTAATPGTWVTSNTFTTNTAAVYNVFIRQTGVGITNPCLFSVQGLPIKQRIFSAIVSLTSPTCSGDKGKIKVAAYGVEPQYTFVLTLGATTIGTSGLIAASDFTFSNLNPGFYTITTTSQDGCSNVQSATITAATTIAAFAAITKPLTCVDGEITLTASGGTAPYEYKLNNAGPWIPLSTPFVVSASGTYSFNVHDSGPCTDVVVVIDVPVNPAPLFIISKSDVKCYGSGSGEIKFNVTNSNGYTLTYSINNGTTYSTSNTFTNLAAGTYNAILKYTLGSAVCFTTVQKIIITTPSFALTASGGVSAVACDTNGGKGKIRITNPQGGLGPYQYNFGAGYQPLNEVSVFPGAYTISIRDANLCVYIMSVIVDPIPQQPTIGVQTPVFSCSGNATSTVIANNGAGNFTYTYSLDGVQNTPPSNNVFPNVLCGDHTFTVKYQLVTVSTYSNLLFETFGNGPNTTAPGIASAYCWNNQPFPPGQPCGTAVAGYPPADCSGTGPYGSTYVIEDNQYVVTSALNPNICVWYDYRDHTSNGTDPTGRFLAVNIGNAAGNYGVLYSKQINDVIPNQPVLVELYVANLIRAGLNGFDAPDFLIELVDSSNIVVASQLVGLINNTADAWVFKSISLNPGTNTSLTFKIRSGSTKLYGNDAVIDDINVYQLPVSCLNQKSFTTNIPCNKAFTAQITSFTNVSCSGVNDGTITISAQNFNFPAGFQYSINNGVTWINSNVSPTIISGLAPGNYPVGIRFDSTSTTCTFAYTQIVTAPFALITSASVTLQPTCLVGATISASATGGTAPFQYQLSDASGTTIVRPYQTSADFTNVPSGTYLVFGRDYNGCIDPINAPITIDAPTAPSATISLTSDFCYDAANAATLIVTASLGAPPYSYSINNGTTYQTSDTFSNLVPGTYTIIVKDSKNCSITLTAQSIVSQLILDTKLTKDLDCTTVSNATITGTIAGGYSGYSYTVSFNGGAPSAAVAVTGTTYAYTATAAGTYVFVVTDTKGCTAQSSLTINALLNPSVVINQINASCGNSNGSFNIIASSGTPPYQYAFNGSTTFTNVSGYSSLAVGTYTFQVKDAKSCLFDGSVTISTPSAISGTAVVTTDYTCLDTATVKALSVSGGSPGYTYSIDGVTFQGFNSFSGLTTGTYSITIKDTAGCTFLTNSVTILPLSAPTDLSFSTTAITCPSNTTNVTISTVGSNAPFQYQITQPISAATAYQASNVFSNLSPGSYTFQVIDAKSCTYSEYFTITPITPIAVLGQLVGNVKCFGTSTGSVNFTVSGFSTNYNYTINAGAPIVNQSSSTINLTNLPAGSYNISVTDNATNCLASAIVTVDQSTAPLAVSTTVSPITCISNGSVTLTSAGGWGGNNYILTPPSGPVVGPQTSNVFTNLTALGTYTITTTDSNSCAVDTTFSLVAPVAPTATIASSSNFCISGSAGASLQVNAAGGLAPYQYNINGGPFLNSNVFNNLVSGNYSIIVKDANGCSVKLASQFIAPQLSLSMVYLKDLDCTVDPNATLKGTIIDGKPGPGSSYTVSIGSGAPSAAVAVTSTTFVYTATGPGVYNFSLTDVAGCTAKASITVNALVNPIITSVTQPQAILCNGDSNGALNVVINPNAGVGPFVINVLNTTTGVNYGTQTAGLPSGNYTITVTDAKSCTDIKTNIIIAQPDIIDYTVVQTDIRCTGTGTSFGTISVTALTGGVAPYTYILSNNIGQPSQAQTSTGGIYTFTVLNFGIYEMNVVDSNGCTIKKQNIVMSSPPSDLTIDTSAPTATCIGGGTIKVTVSAAVLSTTYYFALYQAPYPTYPNVVYQAADAGTPYTTTFTGLTPGVTYSFVVYDAITNCYYFKQASAPVPTLSTLTSNVNVVNNATCNGSNNASVSFTFSNYSGTAVSYQIFNSQSNTAVGASTTLTGLSGAPTSVSNFGVLAPSSYYILFTENNGCTNASDVFTTTQSATVLSLSATVIKNDNCKNNAGQIAITAQGGTPPYTYQLLPNGNPPPTAASAGWLLSSVISSESGNFVAYVKDANGCIQATSINLALDPAPVIVAVNTDLCTANQGAFTIDVFVTTAGISPYSYSLDGAPFQISAGTGITYNNLLSGTHIVTIRDANGCSESTSIKLFDPLVNAPIVTALPSCADNDGVITVTTQGGAGPYSLIIQPNVGGITLTGNVFSGVPSGSYNVILTDTATGCSKTTAVTLGAPTAVTFTTSVSNVSCNSGNNGIITVNLPPSNDNPTYNYQLNSGAVQTSNVFVGLTAGTYTITVTSGRACSATQTGIIVTEPKVLVASASATAFNCNALNATNASTISVSGSGGTIAYKYSIDGSNYFLSNIFTVVDSGNNQTKTLYVKDANDCIASTTITLITLQSITATAVSQTTAITCVNTGEIIQIIVTGGSGNFSYQLLPSGIAQVSNVFTITGPGSYTFEIKDLITGCTRTTAPYTIAQYNNATVTASQLATIQCFGQSSGSINVNVTGYAGAYNYTVNNGATTVASGTGNTTTNPQLISGLAAGNYIVEIKETITPFCTVMSNSVNIGSPASALSVSITNNVNANCNTGSQVTAAAAGGTAPYTFAFAQASTIPTPAAYTPSATANLDPATNTSWDVYVKDVNNCTTFVNVTIAKDAAPTVNNTTAINANCAATSSFVITVTGTGVAPVTYSIGSGFQGGTTFTVSAPGDYFVTIKDGNGCTAKTATITILPALDLTVSVASNATCLDANASIAVAASGGSGNFQYQIDTLPFQLLSTINNVGSGMHSITIKDLVTGCTKTTSLTLSAATAVTLNAATVTDVTCNLGNDGLIVINLAPTSTGINGNPNYSFSIITGPQTRPVQFSNVFTNLPAGSYTVLVTSGRSCAASQTVVIDQPKVIIVPTPTVTQFGCVAGTNTPNYALVSVGGVNGGSGIYNNYQFIRNNVVVQFGTSTSYIDSNFAGASYVIQVFDSKGCSGITTASIIISPFIEISNPVIAVSASVTCLTTETIKVTVTASSGAPSLQFTAVGLSGNPYNQTNTTGVFSGLSVGSYEITITNSTTGCSLKTYHYINSPSTFALEVNNLTSVICYGSNEGSVSVKFIDLSPTPVNDAGAFNYVITGPTPSSGTTSTAGPVTISNLLAGTYSITATLKFSPFCDATYGFTVQQSDTKLAVSATQSASVTCDNNKGAITATAIGGWPGTYQYALSGAATVPYSNNNVFLNLSAGNYTIKAKDSAGCEVSATITLVIPTPISASLVANVVSLACFEDTTGSVTVTNTSGGQGSGYIYTLNNLSLTPPTKSGPVTTNVFSGLTAGSYSVTIIDGYNCSITTLPVIIAEPAKVKADLSFASLQTCKLRARLILTASGGTPPFTYSADGVTFTTTTFNPSITFDVPVGTYSYFIKDANGCVSKESKDAINAAIPVLNVNVVASSPTVNCFGDNTGSIIANAQGGLGNYSYILTNSITGVSSPAQSSGNFNNLVAGSYQIKVTSVDCNAFGNIVITQPNSPLVFTPSQTNVTCNGAGNGKITIIASGGTGLVTFAISPNLNQFFTTNTFNNLLPGDYNMIIQDANGCFLPYKFTISEPANLSSALQGILTQELCVGDNSASFVINVAGGTLPYSYSVDNQNGPFTTGTSTQTQFTITGQGGGTHFVYVRDFNGCITQKITVALDQAVSIGAVATPNLYCPDASVFNDVTITVNQLVVGQVQYSLDGGAYQASNIFTNLTPGSHFVNVKHTNGCTTPKINFVITVVAPLTLNLVQGGLNQIVAIASGGNGGFQYTLNGVSYGTTNTFIIDVTATYSVTVTDAKGCAQTKTIPMVFVDIFIPNVFTPNGDGINDGWTPQNTINYKNLVYYIFDRYGRKIVTRKEGEFWDGTYNGMELPSGDYWYVVKVDGEASGANREFVGNVTLYR